MKKRSRNKRNRNRNQINYEASIRRRDSTFCMLFGSEKYKQNALSLYNALSREPCRDVSELTIYTLEDAVYMKRKNDVGYLVKDDMRLQLVEAQTTVNLNMPLRGLIYFAETYSSYISMEEKNIYGSRLVKLPTPQYVVLYDGDKETTAVQKLRLSDAFEDGSVKEEFEWTATVYNIRHKENEWLSARCRALEEYREFNERVRKYSMDLPLKTAVDRAVDECIEEGILADFLRKHRSEVRMSIISEFNQKVYEKDIREEGREEGRIEGRIEGREEGRTEGRLEICYEMYRKRTLSTGQAAEILGLPSSEAFLQACRDKGWIVDKEGTD